MCDQDAQKWNGVKNTTNKIMILIDHYNSKKEEANYL